MTAELFSLIFRSVSFRTFLAEVLALLHCTIGKAKALLIPAWYQQGFVNNTPSAALAASDVLPGQHASYLQGEPVSIP